jgi:hypothetical protein
MPFLLLKFIIKHIIIHSYVSSFVHAILSRDPIINTNCSLGLNVFVDYPSNHKRYTSLSPNGKTCIFKDVLINEFGNPYCIFQNLLILHLMLHHFLLFLPLVFFLLPPPQSTNYSPINISLSSSPFHLSILFTST